MKVKVNYRNNIQKEKVFTHFRNLDDYNLCVQVPNLNKFIDKYYDIIENDFTAFGYLFHLYTDKMFFDNLFNDTFEFLDKNGNKTIYSNEAVIIKIKKNNLLYKSSDFWNGDNPVSIYHDYTVMNKMLLEYYGTSFDEDEYMAFVPFFKNPGIEEVDYKNVRDVIKNTASYIKESCLEKSNVLNVFDKNKVVSFIDEISENFLMNYYNQIPLKNKKILKK